MSKTNQVIDSGEALIFIYAAFIVGFALGCLINIGVHYGL